MGNFKMKQDTLASPRSYQGVAKIKGMSNEEAKSIDEHDAFIPKKEEKKKIPNITMNNNFTQTATGGTRFSKPAASKRLREYDPEVGKKSRKKTDKAKSTTKDNTNNK